MNNKLKLKPCPFCGSDDVYIRVHCNEEGEEVGAQIECHGCVSIYVHSEAINLKELVSAWNRRADVKREYSLCWSKQGLYPDGFSGMKVGYTCPYCHKYVPYAGRYCGKCGERVLGGDE